MKGKLFNYNVWIFSFAYLIFASLIGMHFLKLAFLKIQLHAYKHNLRNILFVHLLSMVHHLYFDVLSSAPFCLSSINCLIGDRTIISYFNSAN